MVRSFGGLSNWTHSRVDRWRFLTVALFGRGLFFGSSIFVETRCGGNFIKYLPFRLRDEGVCATTRQLQLTAVNPRTVEKMFQRDANSSPHYRGLKFAPFFLLWKMETASIIYIKVKNWKKIWQTFYPIKFSFNF